MFFNMTEIENIKRDYALYQVALKILLRRGGEVLMLWVSEGHYDFPGGRIDNVEGEVPLMQILDREIQEEIGTDVKYQVGKPLFQFRRFYKGVYILQTVYDGEYLGGEVQLSEEHERFCWVNPHTTRFAEKEFCSKEEYEAVKNYFNKSKVLTTL